MGRDRQIIKNGFGISEGDYAGKFDKRLEDGVDQKVPVLSPGCQAVFVSPSRH
jgi:hypothetical protein